MDVLLFFEVILIPKKMVSKWRGRYRLRGRDYKSQIKCEPCRWFLLLNYSLFWNFAWAQCKQSYWGSCLKTSMGIISMQIHEVLPWQGGISQCFPKPGPQRRWWWGRRKHRMWSPLRSNSVLPSVRLCVYLSTHLSIYLSLVVKEIGELELLGFHDGNVGLSEISWVLLGL